MFRMIVSSMLSLLFICSGNLSFSATGPFSEEKKFEDLDGRTYLLKASPEHKALVLIFVTTDCPIANSYLPTLAKLHQCHHMDAFEFILVHEGPNQTASKLKDHAKEYQVPFPVAMDVNHTIARSTGAIKTPEVFVLGDKGQILYQGRIDNLHHAFGKKRASATREDLRIALEEIAAGKKVSVDKTEAVGCTIQLK